MNRSYGWFPLAGLQIILACQQLKPLQRLLCTRTVRYLADISFALYLMHGLMNDIFLLPIVDRLYTGIGGREEAKFWGRMIVWVAGLLSLGSIYIWAADVFWRWVDIPSVRFARWLENKCIKEE